MRRIFQDVDMLKPSDFGVPADASTIAIFEWVNGGGLSDVALEKIPKSLLAEGQAMLCTLIHGLTTAGAKLVVPVDVRLMNHTALRQISSQAELIAVGDPRHCDWLETWCRLAKRNTWSWLVAPESQGILRRIACHLRLAGAQLLNADDEFLGAASDKLACAGLFQQAAVDHPPTKSLQTVDDAWLSRSTCAAAKLRSGAVADQELWVIKPVDGAGGEGVQIVDRSQVLQLKKSLVDDCDEAGQKAEQTLIVQPRLNGIAASCSAIVDGSGRAHWLPVVSQDFAVLEPPALAYLGCTYPAPGIPAAAPTELLKKALSSIPGKPLGWIGFDLVFDPLTHQWWVIEINPRCTSSMVGLASAYAGNLVHDCFLLQTASHSQLSAQFAPVVFRVARSQPVKSREAADL